jgi:2-dehydropantoate 2-reductase
MHKHTRVAVLQNGVEHVARFAPYVDAARIVPAIVDIPAECSAPGIVRQRRFGSILVPNTKDGADFAALFAHTRVEAAAIEDFVSAAWRKLCVNCAGAVFVLTNQPAGVTHRDDIAALMLALMEECAAVGRAEGASIEPEFPRSIIAGYRAGAKESVTSILADRHAGRQMEIDARNGVIVRLGAKHGIETPLNNAVAALMSAM